MDKLIKNNRTMECTRCKARFLEIDYKTKQSNKKCTRCGKKGMLIII